MDGGIKLAASHLAHAQVDRLHLLFGERYILKIHFFLMLLASVGRVGVLLPKGESAESCGCYCPYKQ